VIFLYYFLILIFCINQHLLVDATRAAKALSTLASTAAFDKNPQSKQRGITLDLGFSAFTTDPSPRLRGSWFTPRTCRHHPCRSHRSPRRRL
jgi:selenocysteine-specific elongation factor